MAAATHTTLAQFSTCDQFRSFTPTSLPPRPSNRSVRCSCADNQKSWREMTLTSRRLVSVSLLFIHGLPYPQHAIAGNIFDKYVKRKKLEPLESYVPAVILTQLQIKDLEKILEFEEPQYASCRSLLRSGPAASFRANVRAVAQYASDDGKGKTAFDCVDQCLRALDELDSLLLRASRNDPGASVKLMKGKINTTLNAVDSLLRTVPLDVLEQGKAIADAYRTPTEDGTQPQELEGDLKELESIL